MYGPVRFLALKVLKAPMEPPDAPAGSHDSIQIYRASPKYLRYRLIGWAIGMAILFLVVVVVLVAGIAEKELGAVVIAGLVFVMGLVIAFLSYFSVRIDYDMRYYIVTDRSLRVRQGAMVVKEMTITHANVQNLRVVQGPLLRLFGIWNLIVETAGGGSASAQGDSSGGNHAIRMAGIENAHEVRDLILGHLRKRGGGAGLGDLDDEHETASSAEMVAVLNDLCASAAGLRLAAERRHA